MNVEEKIMGIFSVHHSDVFKKILVTIDYKQLQKLTEIPNYCYKIIDKFVELYMKLTVINPNLISEILEKLLLLMVTQFYDCIKLMKTSDISNIQLKLEIDFIADVLKKYKCDKTENVLNQITEKLKNNSLDNDCKNLVEKYFNDAKSATANQYFCFT